MIVYRCGFLLCLFNVVDSYYVCFLLCILTRNFYYVLIRKGLGTIVESKKFLTGRWSTSLGIKTPVNPTSYRETVFAGVFIICLITANLEDCGYLLELPHLKQF